MKAGVVSVTFRALSPGEIIALVKRAGLSGIEWGGDVHVPHGDLNVARRVRAATEEAGLAVAAYGSYYRAGVAGGAAPAFDAVLATALELGAPVIRVWAGDRGSAGADAAWRGQVAADLRRIGSAAAGAGIRVALEYHGNTLTDDIDSAMDLMEVAGRENAGLYWQPLPGKNADEWRDSLRRVRPHLVNVHLYHWASAGGRNERRPLAEGEAAWRPQLDLLADPPFDGWILMEFVKDDRPEQLVEDAAVLRSWLERKTR